MKVFVVTVGDAKGRFQTKDVYKSEDDVLRIDLQVEVHP